MNDKSKVTADFCLKIDFEKGSENPSRVFKAMSELIDAMKFLDQELIGTIDSRIEPVLLLEDVETGSIKAWLAQGLRQVPDDALNDLDWKPVVGQYLVKAKWITINFLEGTTEITDAAQFAPLADQIQQIAEETQVKKLPFYTQPSIKGLMESTSKISSALSQLNQNDHASYITDSSETSFNMKLSLAPENIEQLLTVRTISTPQEMILKIKRPDYLGEAQWEFRHGKQTINAKIADKNWLSDFQNRLVDARPGDCLVAIVEVNVNYGLDDEVIGYSHKVLDVKEVKPGPKIVQKKLDYEA